MITLEAAEAFFPERTVTVEERAAELEVNAAQAHKLRRYDGLDRMHYDPDIDLYDLLLPPAQKILAGTDPRCVRYVLYCHALHGASGVAADTTQQIRRRLGLEHAEAFSLTQQNCAIPLSAIDVAGALLRADGDPEARALIVTGEKPSLRVAKYINTCLIADGAASCLVAWNGIGTRVLSFSTRTKGEYYDGLLGTPEQFNAIAQLRPRIVSEVMQEAVDRAGCTLDDIQLIIPANQGVAFWTGTIEREELLRKCLLENNARFSHCLAADALINYAWLHEQRRLEPDRPAMFIATGLGWTFSAMVFLPQPTSGAGHR